MSPHQIAVLMACHNRRLHTLECLGSITTQELPAGHQLAVLMLDDGSTDGTSEGVAARFPEVRILEGDGSLYWCGGMRKVWAEAAINDPDYYLLVNDDTTLMPEATAELLKIVGGPQNRTIAVATIADEQSGDAIYGGISVAKKRVLRPDDEELHSDTFNANCALVPRAVYREMGNLHETYTHSMGDFDYGYQAVRRGIQVIRSRGFLGQCHSNPLSGTWRDRTLPRRVRLRKLQDIKALPFREWLAFSRRNLGWKWPYYAISPMLRILCGR